MSDLTCVVSSFWRWRGGATASPADSARRRSLRGQVRKLRWPFLNLPPHGPASSCAAGTPPMHSFASLSTQSFQVGRAGSRPRRRHLSWACTELRCGNSNTAATPHTPPTLPAAFLASFAGLLPRHADARLFHGRGVPASAAGRRHGRAAWHRVSCRHAWLQHDARGGGLPCTGPGGHVPGCCWVPAHGHAPRHGHTARLVTARGRGGWCRPITPPLHGSPPHTLCSQHHVSGRDGAPCRLAPGSA